MSRLATVPSVARVARGLTVVGHHAVPERAPSSPAPGGRPVTVRAALDLPVLRRGLPDVVAGRAHLDRPIRWVHAGELPEMATLLSGGELLLTTGLGLGPSAAEQAGFAASLAARGIAALVIELGRTLAELPTALVEAAERHGLTVVALRRPVRFVEVSEAIQAQLVHSEYALLRRGQEIHRGLTALMVGGDGIPGLLAALAATLRAAVFLRNGEGRLLSHAVPEDTGVDALSLWQADHPAETLVAEVPVPEHQSPAALVLLPLRATLDPVAPIALEHAAAMVALALLRARQEEELLSCSRGSFLADLAAGRMLAADACRRAASEGLPGDCRMLLPVAAELRTAAPVSRAARAAALDDLQHELRSQGQRVLVGATTDGDGVLAVLCLRRAEARDAAAVVLATALRDFAERQFGSCEVTVAAGRAGDWEQCAAELRLARECALTALALPPACWHDAASLELERLLWRWRGDSELAEFVDRTLGPLMAHDRRRKSPLLPTLEALLDNGGRKAETARALYLNRQALYHRVHRIEQLLGVDLSDSEARLTVHVALRARAQL